MIPKIKFRAMNIQENIGIIKWAYYEGNGVLSVHDYTVQYFPELASLDSTSKEEIDKKIEEVVSKRYKQNITIIQNKSKRI